MPGAALSPRKGKREEEGGSGERRRDYRDCRRRERGPGRPCSPQTFRPAQLTAAEARPGTHACSDPARVPAPTRVTLPGCPPPPASPRGSPLPPFRRYPRAAWTAVGAVAVGSLGLLLYGRRCPGPGLRCGGVPAAG